MTFRRGDGRGAVLLIAMMAVIFLCAVGTSALTMMLSSWKGGRQRRAVEMSRVVAENGLEYALWRIDREPSWGGEQRVEVPMGECALRVGVVAGMIDVQSEALGDAPKVTVSARYRRLAGGGFETVSWSESVER